MPVSFVLKIFTRFMQRKAFVICILFNLISISWSLAQEYAGKINFGAKAGINYSMIGNKSSRYAGLVMPSLSGFISYQPVQTATFVAEAGYSGNGFRQQQNDTKYQMDGIDLSLYSMIYPSRTSNDLAFVFGIRPSLLIAHSTEAFKAGSFFSLSDPYNQNKNGQIDVGAVFGISLALSPVVNIELLYQAGLSDRNDASTIKGKPSAIEIGLRLNAQGIQDMQQSKADKLREQVSQYRKGVMLVMLPTPAEAQLAELRRRGAESLIILIEDNYAVNNRIIMNEFSREFNFCPVYFFYDKDAYKVVSGNTSGIFLNKDFQIDSTLNIDTAGYFVSSICYDLSHYTQRNQLGLYVYNNKLVQLDKPFNPNLIDFMNSGNPIDYLNGRKMLTYNPYIIRKKIRKLNSRLLRML